MAGAEERHKQVTSEMNKKLESQEALLQKNNLERREQALLLVGLQNEIKEQTITITKLRKERDEARSEADDAHRGAISIFNEQKKHESHIQRLQADIHRANSAVEKMRAEAVSVRIKNQDVRDDRANLQRLFDSAAAENQRFYYSRFANAIGESPPGVEYSRAVRNQHACRADKTSAEFQ